MSVGGHSLALPFPDTGGPYAYRTFEAALDLRGVHEMGIGLRGAMRLARVDVVPAKKETA